MPDRTFGWDYPPGVTGNEPQIAGYPEGEGCVVCGVPFDYEEATKLTGSVYVCGATCEARYIVDHAGEFGPRQVLDAVADLEDVVVRVLRGLHEPLQGRVVGRTGLTREVLGYTLEDDQGDCSVVSLGSITGVKVVL